jgi:hypothetical protein
MQNFFLVFLFVFQIAFSQITHDHLSFDKQYFRAVDQWVAFPKSKADTTFIYGFVYLDNHAGFTFNYEGKFQIKNEISSSVFIKYTKWVL